MNETHATLEIETPLGIFVLAATRHGLSHALFAGSEALPCAVAAGATESAHLEAGRAALVRYFEGEPDPWRALTLAPQGTPFQQRVWNALRHIPHGATCSYRTLADEALRDSPTATERGQQVGAGRGSSPAAARGGQRDGAGRGSAPLVRAVGQALRRNPLGVIVPCHRVIRADGHLGGYAGGLERKRWLLQHERVRAPALAPDWIPAFTGVIPV